MREYTGTSAVARRKWIEVEAELIGEAEMPEALMTL